MERYRSGHNEAVLKTVCPQGRVGSNPTLSAVVESTINCNFVRLESERQKNEKVLTTTVKCCKINIAVAQSGERTKLESKGFPYQMRKQEILKISEFYF